MYFPTIGGLMLTLFTLILNEFYSVFAISGETKKNKGVDT